MTKAADGGSDLDVKTATGTKLLKEFPGTNSDIYNLTPVGSKLLFFADSATAQQLWMTSGTRAGTRLVKKLNHSGAERTDGHWPRALFHLRRDPWQCVHRLLFKSNGTAAGTVPVAMPAGSAGIDNPPGALVDYDGVLYFGVGDRLMKTSGPGPKVVIASAHPMRTGHRRVRGRSDRPVECSTSRSPTHLSRARTSTRPTGPPAGPRC